MMKPHDHDHRRKSSRGNAGLRNSKAGRRRIYALLIAGARPDCRVHFTHEGAPSKLAWAGSPSPGRIRDFPTLASRRAALGWATRPGRGKGA